MKYKAVIFDLFGTLIENLPLLEYHEVMNETAKLISVPEDEFGRLWLETFNQRMTGDFPTITANIEHICKALNVPVKNEAIAIASDLHSDIAKRLLVPRSDVPDTMRQLRAAGYKIGLVSDCSGEVPPLWDDTALVALIDETVFSCDTGTKKPDPYMYLLACEKLGVKPTDCLYIGDGCSQELTGASQVGMYPIQIISPLAADNDFWRINSENWPGTKISAISQVLEFA